MFVIIDLCCLGIACLRCLFLICVIAFDVFVVMVNDCALIDCYLLFILFVVGYGFDCFRFG